MKYKMKECLRKGDIRDMKLTNNILVLNIIYNHKDKNTIHAKKLVSNIFFFSCKIPFQPAAG